MNSCFSPAHRPVLLDTGRHRAIGRLLKLALAACLAAASYSPMQAAAQWRTDPKEVAPLPKYCHSRMLGDTHESTQYWTRMMGSTYEHIHHYCRGLVYTNRVKLNPKRPQDRKFALEQSIGEFDYVITRAPRNFVLLPEILLKKGENLFKLNRVEEAMTALQVAIDIKPDYWPPYAAISDHFKRLGDTKNARQWLDKALAVAPDSRALRTRLAELDPTAAAKAPPPAAKTEKKPPAARAPEPTGTPEKEAQAGESPSAAQR